MPTCRVARDPSRFGPRRFLPTIRAKYQRSDLSLRQRFKAPKYKGYKAQKVHYVYANKPNVCQISWVTVSESTDVLL